MKILQINSRYVYASTGRTAYELDQYLIKHGHESYVACVEDLPFDSENKNIYYIGWKFGRRMHAILSRVTGKQAHFSTIATRRLENYIDKICPDVVHIRNVHANYINFPHIMNYLAKRKIPVVITLHDCWFFTGRCCFFLGDNCYRWQEKCGKCPCLDKWNKSLFFDFSEQLLKEKKKLFSNLSRFAVIGVSKWITEQAQKSILNDSAFLVDYIYNWIDFGTFYPRSDMNLKKKLNVENKYILLGVSQRWTDSKGINDIIAVSKHLNKDEIIVLVGRYKKANELPENIVLIEPTENTSELANLYSMSDIFLNLSHMETFGKVTAEALSCGVPAIVYDVTACPELIGKGCGLVCQEGNIEEVVNAISRIRHSPDIFTPESCVRFSKLMFDKEKNIEKYIDVYNKLIGDQQSGK